MADQSNPIPQESNVNESGYVTNTAAVEATPIVVQPFPNTPTCK